MQVVGVEMFYGFEIDVFTLGGYHWTLALSGLNLMDRSQVLQAFYSLLCVSYFNYVSGFEIVELRGHYNI